MAIQSVANGMGFLLENGSPGITIGSGNNNTIDAAGESVAFIGKMYIEGAASSKTISSAGGKIFFRAGTVTFANAGTNFRIGIQDVASTGLEDGTFDVYADFTGGGGGLTTNTFFQKAMTTGSKTINHGDVIAIVFEMTTRGGTDSVIITGYNPRTQITVTNSTFPYKTQDTGTGPARSNAGIAGASIIFDDGTIGWIEMAYMHPYTAANTSYTQTSTPDEYAAVFQVPFKCRVRGGYLNVGSIASTDNFDIILYSDAEGTPVAERTVSVDPNYTGSTSNNNVPYNIDFSSFELTPGEWYALACRPTTSNDVTIWYNNLTTTFGNIYKKPLPFGANCKFSARTNQSGAFTEVQTYFMPIFGLLIDGLDDGAGGGGAEPFTTVFIH